MNKLSCTKKEIWISILAIVYLSCGRLSYEQLAPNDSDSESSADTQSDIDTGTQSDIDTDTQSDIDTDTQSDIDTNTDSDSSSGTDTGVIPNPCVFRVDINATTNELDGLSWSTAFKQVQPAIDRAAATGVDCEIWVAEGVYKVYQSDPLDTIQLVAGVDVYGGFGGEDVGETERGQRDWTTYETVFHGSGSVYHVVKGASGVVLDGISITDGNANGTESSDRKGAGLQLLWDGGIVIRNVSFKNNQAQGRGGAVHILGGSPVFENCVFQNNLLTATVSDYGGAVYIDNSTVYFTDTLFDGNGDGNTSEGCAVYVNAGTGIFSGCGFENNRCLNSGTVYGLNGTLQMFNVEFRNNEVGWRGAAVDLVNGNLFLVSGVVAQNAGASGAGIYLTDAAGYIRNLTSAYNQGISLVLEDSAGYSVQNSVFFNPSIIPEIHVVGDPVDVEYSLIRDGYVGDGNIDGDPLFVNSPIDLSIRNTSPCIDAANGTVAPTRDFLNKGRYDVPEVPNTGIGNPPYSDMGAYEYTVFK